MADVGYEALIVDYGGVMTTPMAASFAQFCLETGVSPERLRVVLAVAYRGELGDEAIPEGFEDLVPALETGRMPVEEFNERLAAHLSEGLDRPVDATDLTARLFGATGPDARMVDAVRFARSQGLKTALLSNTWGIGGELPTYDGIFDVIILSGREGLRKPDPEIFHLAARRLGVTPAACVFVDDLAANVEAARAIGMTAIVHRSADFTIPRLEELFRMTLG